MNDKNKYGQYFTISTIAKFMVGLISHPKAASVLEPSCGAGVFLNELEKSGFSNIDAYEIDPELSRDHAYVKHESFVSSPLTPYDVVIGNPPYIRWKNLEQELKDELATSPLWNKYFNSLCDYLFIFILKSIEQLNNGGELIFICTEYWMNTTNSVTLRDYMTENGYISEIYHFKEAPLFEGVNASFVVFRYVKSSKKEKQIALYQYNKTGCPEYEELINGSCFNKVNIPSFEKGKRWLLATEEQQRRLARFEDSCCEISDDIFSTPKLNRVGDICDIGNGMVSGLDKAFNITGIDGLTEQEKKYCINVLKAKDLGFYTYSSESKYFFITDKITEEDFVSSFPNCYKHIFPFIEDLGKRYNYGRDTAYWEFIFPRNYTNLFSRPEKRIFVPCKERISNKNHFRFVLADANYFPLQDVTGIILKPECRESIEYLLAFLNNERVFEWLYFNGIVKGYIVEFSEAPIASIPYRKIDWNNPKEVCIHDNITSAVKNYLTSKDSEFLAIINENFNNLLI